MANSTKKIIKKKTKKVKQKNQVEDNKVREEQFVKLEHQKEMMKSRVQDQNIDRLKQALILAEIVGSPRCKVRHSRGSSRRYGG